MMQDTDKVSLGVAAQYIGVSIRALEALTETGWLKPCDYAPGRIPIYLGVDLKRMKSSAPTETPEEKMQKEIRRRHDELTDTIDSANIMLSALRAECKHPNAVKVNKSDTGNWDRSQDSYWRECKCPDCGRYWTENQ